MSRLSIPEEVAALEAYYRDDDSTVVRACNDIRLLHDVLALLVTDDVTMPSHNNTMDLAERVLDPRRKLGEAP